MVVTTSEEASNGSGLASLEGAARGGRDLASGGAAATEIVNTSKCVHFFAMCNCVFFIVTPVKKLLKNP
jgi:hypothetical protein